jgi:hypothetical protein
MAALEDDDLRAKRTARNKTLRRDVNERIATLYDKLQVQATFRDFICECALPACREPVHLTVTEYESVRRDRNLFVVVPDDAHVVPDFENVVERFDRYWTVKKRGSWSRKA